MKKFRKSSTCVHVRPSSPGAWQTTVCSNRKWPVSLNLFPWWGWFTLLLCCCSISQTSAACFFSPGLFACARVCVQVCLHQSIWSLRHALSQKLIHILTVKAYNESPRAYMLAHTVPDLISWHASCAIILGVVCLFLSILTFEKNRQRRWTLWHSSNNRGGLQRLWVWGSVFNLSSLTRVDEQICIFVWSS